MERNPNIPIGALIKFIDKQFVTNIREVCLERGINSTYSHIIMHLARRGEPVPQNDIAEHTHLSAPTTSLTLKQMETLGYIKKIPDENDSRKTLITLTDLGRSIDEEIKKCFDEVEKQMVKGLDGKTINDFKNIIFEMSDNLNAKGDNR